MPLKQPLLNEQGYESLAGDTGVLLAGWVNREQIKVIECWKAENQMNVRAHHWSR